MSEPIYNTELVDLYGFSFWSFENVQTGVTEYIPIGTYKINKEA